MLLKTEHIKYKPSAGYNAKGKIDAEMEKHLSSQKGKNTNAAVALGSRKARPSEQADVRLEYLKTD